MKSKLGITLGGIALLLLAGGLYYINFKGYSPSQTRSGKVVYSQNCAGCHGANGKGNGSAAEYLLPKPRDFTSGIYKFSSTDNGELPTDADLERVVAEGLNPGGMPGFRNVLSDREIQRVVDYVKTFSDKFQNQKQPDPVEVGSPPDPLLTDARVSKGKKLYDKYGCQNCHGPKGKGDGPTADQQTDRWGEPVRPRDLTRGVYKGGNDPEDIYRRIVTGITGTSMPPMGGAIQSEDDRWALVAYVKSLASKENTPHAPTSNGDDLFVKRVESKQSTLKNPTASVWKTAERVRIPLYSLWLIDRTPFDSVEVRALHNGKELSVRMSWRDPTKNTEPVNVTEYTDGGAVMFPDASGPLPFLGMGSTDTNNDMAHIWHWRASDQLAVNRGGPTHDLEDRYPTMQVSQYPYKDGQEPGQRADFTNRQQHTQNQPELFQSALAAGNTLSKPALQTPVRSYRAKGFGTLTALPDSKMRTDGNGVYDNGWSIVLTRPMRTKTDVVQFEPGESTTAAFAVWDGQQNDRNGQKDITSWITLNLEQSETNKQ